MDDKLSDIDYLTTYHKYSLADAAMLMRVIGNIVLMVGLILSPFAFLNIPVAFYDLIIHPEITLPWNELILFLIFDIFLLLFGVIFPNLFPDLKMDENGLYVRFYFKWLFVPWDNIVSIHESFLSVILSPSKRGYFVLTKKLTPIHWLISLNQLGGWGPGFLISQSISDNHHLVLTIRKHLANETQPVFGKKAV